MTGGSDRMKVTVFTTMPPGVYSGGRYLSLMLAYAMSRAGADVTYITNNAPLFERDFEPFRRLCPIRSIVTPTYTVPDDLHSDWVIVIPTGGFNNRFYKAATDHAQARGARLALVSFETPNWFAAMSPFPRSPMPSESWRQVVAGGGLVVTIAHEGVAPARAYFGEGWTVRGGGSTSGTLRSTIWPLPPRWRWGRMPTAPGAVSPCSPAPRTGTRAPMTCCACRPT